MSQPMLRRSLGEQYWKDGEEQYRKTGKDVLVLKDGRYEFWVVEHNGRMARKSVDGNDSWIEYSMFYSPTPKQS